ncbi:MAG: phosphoribosylformylglycinamidine synthase subunit PurS [Candidatus Micrarchaeota archaeon]|nr:phosphoribosylformylglycinamidine synthase subunit PurS [Candidatus Micrarchaeota archaeon]
MKEYEVVAIIKGKPLAKDPEGETIKKYLVEKKTNSVKKIRTAKMLVFYIQSNSEKEAAEEIKKICNELRIFNPLSHELEVYVK